MAESRSNGSLVLGRVRPELVLPWWSSTRIRRPQRRLRIVEAVRLQGARSGKRPGASIAAARTRQHGLRARTLALVSALRGDQPQAERLARYAEALSRRDLGIQFWLIESSVRRTIFKVRFSIMIAPFALPPGAAEILYPVLVQASADSRSEGAPSPICSAMPTVVGRLCRALIAQGPSPGCDRIYHQRASARSCGIPASDSTGRRGQSSCRNRQSWSRHSTFIGGRVSRWGRCPCSCGMAVSRRKARFLRSIGPCPTTKIFRL